MWLYLYCCSCRSTHFLSGNTPHEPGILILYDQLEMPKYEAILVKMSHDSMTRGDDYSGKGNVTERTKRPPFSTLDLPPMKTAATSYSTVRRKRRVAGQIASLFACANTARPQVLGRPTSHVQNPSRRQSTLVRALSQLLGRLDTA